MTKPPTVQLKNVKWVDTYITKTHDNPPMESQYIYKIKLPDWLAIWDVFADWEREHLFSMAKELKKGDILFDIGAELGWQSVVFSRIVGAENMVLVEPSTEMWGNIKAIWNKNNKVKPLSCYRGLFSDKTTNKKVLLNNKFPRSKSELTVGLSYRNIFEHKKLPQIKLDDYVALTGIIPDAITIDVEGAELLVLKGAEQTLRNNKVKVWISIHPELMEKHYNSYDEEVHRFMKELGYKGEFLAKPCEEHWYYVG
jgi:FkbM family methyltransferase